MTKGISRQIVEITDTASPYFERALLVVRPGCTDCPTPQLQQEARRLMHAGTAYSGLRRARGTALLRQAACFAAGGGLGAALCLLFRTL